jgi:hypothetical protein
VALWINGVSNPKNPDTLDKLDSRKFSFLKYFIYDSFIKTPETSRNIGIRICGYFLFHHLSFLSRKLF